MWTETMFPLSATSNSLPDCWSYAGVGRLKRFGEPFQLFYFTEFFPTPFLQFLFQFSDCHHDFHGCHVVEIQILQFCDHRIFCLLLKEGHLFSNL